MCRVRRLKTIAPSAIRAAIVAYAGPPRGTARWQHPGHAALRCRPVVLAAAASIHDDTALVDEIAALQDEYRVTWTFRSSASSTSR